MLMIDGKSLLSVSVNISMSGSKSLKGYNIFKSIIKASLNRKFCQPITSIAEIFASNTPAKILDFCPISWFDCRKIRIACFPTPGTAPKTRTFVVIFQYFRKIFLRQTVLQPTLQPFFRASLANPRFPCSCPIGILGNLSINSK